MAQLSQDNVSSRFVPAPTCFRFHSPRNVGEVRKNGLPLLQADSVRARFINKNINKGTVSGDRKAYRQGWNLISSIS
jgi:hypothetical protein